MKQKKSLIIFFCIIIILLIFSLICIFKKDKNDRVISMYQNLLNKPQFTFTLEEIANNFKIVVSQDRGNLSIDMNSADEHTTSLAINGDSYFIMHDSQEYYDYGSEEVEANIVTTGLKEITKKGYNNGKEEIYGKNYYYEEYENDDANFVMYTNHNETSNIKTRFYFDGNDIKYIKNIITTDEDVAEELLKITLNYNVDENVFKIPDDYAEVNY